MSKSSEQGPFGQLEERLKNLRKDARRISQHLAVHVFLYGVEIPPPVGYEGSMVSNISEIPLGEGETRIRVIRRYLGHKEDPNDFSGEDTLEINYVDGDGNNQVVTPIAQYQFNGPGKITRAPGTEISFKHPFDSEMHLLERYLLAVGNIEERVLAEEEGIIQQSRVDRVAKQITRQLDALVEAGQPVFEHDGLLNIRGLTPNPTYRDVIASRDPSTGGLVFVEIGAEDLSNRKKRDATGDTVYRLFFTESDVDGGLSMAIETYKIDRKNPYHTPENHTQRFKLATIAFNPRARGIVKFVLDTIASTAIAEKRVLDSFYTYIEHKATPARSIQWLALSERTN